MRPARALRQRQSDDVAADVRSGFLDLVLTLGNPYETISLYFHTLLKARQVKATYRNKTIALVSILVLVGIGGVSAFCLGLYRQERLYHVRRDAGVGIQRLADHLQSLFLLAENVSVRDVDVSSELIFVVDGVCGSTRKDSAVSASFTKHFSDIDASPSDWLTSFELYKACNSAKSRFQVVNTDLNLMVPYVTALVRKESGPRLVAVSVEGFEGGSGSTLFMLNRKGELIWSADGEAYVRTAFLDTELDPSYLKTIVEAAAAGDSGVMDVRAAGLIAYAPVNSEWTLVSLSYKPTLLQAVNYAITQSLLLIAGIVFICLFFGKRIAESIVRPLSDLKKSAEEIGKGRFDRRLEAVGNNEVAAVKSAFNVMIDKIQALIIDAQRKTELEAEFKTVAGVHKMLFPPKNVRATEHALHSIADQATICGGDWWGYLELPRSGRPPLFLILIGDVTGHGTESALVAAAVRGGLSVIAQYLEEEGAADPDPSRILQHFNRAVCESANGALAMTFFVALMDTTKKKLYCANAGHNRPYLILPKVKEDTVTYQLRPIGIATGAPLGYALDSVYEGFETHPWLPGSKLFLYTDGLIDSDQFGRNKLRKALDAHARLGARSLLAKVMQEHRTATGGAIQPDDITVVMCEITDGT
ncbi:MAG: hypothetical protein A2X94_00400 [Bdellovibrionales bacterium GWB1_55_8]|nr:MAG: hypothetical protein A2X94_00400 [Bdellovibrionales bacterium GWB1_55_8]